MKENDEELPVSIGSGGFVECEYEEMRQKDNITVGELKQNLIGDVIDKIKNYYNSYCDINGRPPSRTFFNEFLDTFK
jgi:hypothetical protein